MVLWLVRPGCGGDISVHALALFPFCSLPAFWGSAPELPCASEGSPLPGSVARRDDPEAVTRQELMTIGLSF